jgi:hypothetical protein
MVHKTLLAKVAFVLATLGPGSTSIFAQVAPTQQTSQATTQQAGQTTPQKTKPQATKPSLIDFLSKSVFYNGDGGDLVFQTPDNPGVPLKAMNFTVKGENYGLKLSPSEQTSITALGQKVSLLQNFRRPERRVDCSECFAV